MDSTRLGPRGRGMMRANLHRNNKSLSGGLQPTNTQHSEQHVAHTECRGPSYAASPPPRGWPTLQLQAHHHAHVYTRVSPKHAARADKRRARHTCGGGMDRCARHVPKQRPRAVGEPVDPRWDAAAAEQEAKLVGKVIAVAVEQVIGVARPLALHRPNEAREFSRPHSRGADLDGRVQLWLTRTSLAGQARARCGQAARPLPPHACPPHGAATKGVLDPIHDDARVEDTAADCGEREPR